MSSSTEKSSHAADDHSHGGSHEKSDVNIEPLVKFAVFVLVFTPLVAYFIVILFNNFDLRLSKADAVAPMQNMRGKPPEPLLQASPSGDLKIMRAQEAAILGSYGWISKPSGQVRIPIERAIELVAERGLPARAAESHP